MRKNHTKKTQKITRWYKRILLLVLLLLLGGIIWREYTTKEAARQISGTQQWNLTLVNEWNELPETFDDTLTLMELSNGQKVDTRVYPYLQKMFNDMRSANVYPVVREAYRTKEAQQAILEERIQRYIAEGYSESRAKKAALQYVALPGYSEHHLGSAIDINADTSMSTNEDVYQWLAKNAYNYGFILRYPPDKENITGISYEPWHYRYVGIDAAAEIYEKNLCLEEYL